MSAESGTRHLFAGRMREAILDLESAVLAEPTHGAHHNLAVALRASGDIAGALHHAAAASALAPRCAPTLALLGSLHSLAGDPATALATFRHALVVDPTHDVSRYYLGVALAQAGDRDAAIETLRVVRRVPSSVHARIEAQIADLRASTSAAPSDLCSVPLVAELVGVSAEASPAPPLSSPAGRAIDLEEARSIIRRATRIVALTGAGISSASGLATRKELWRRYDRDNAVSIAQFHRDPLPLWTVIADFLGQGPLEPNAAHRALATLPHLAGIITQNVDGLHQAAHSPCPIIELHGTLLETRCDACGARPGLSCADAIARSIPPPCACGAALRPDVVLFGEWVDPARLERATALSASGDVMLVVGTAADVAPAADLPLLAASRGATVIEIKRAPSRIVRAGAVLHLSGTAEELLPRLV